MTTLQLYRGPRLQLTYNRRLGSPSSVCLLVDGRTIMRAGPSDFISLQAWLRDNAQQVAELLSDPGADGDAQRVADNLRGDVP